METDHTKVAEAMYDAIRAAADNGFFGDFDFEYPVTIDGSIDFMLAAHVLVDRLISMGIVQVPPSSPNQS